MENSTTPQDSAAMPPASDGSGSYPLLLNEYQIANLRSLLQACGYGGARIRSPLWVANTGDWIGEIFNMLPEVDHLPNADDATLSQRANNYK